MIVNYKNTSSITEDYFKSLCVARNPLESNYLHNVCAVMNDLLGFDSEPIYPYTSYVYSSHTNMMTYYTNAVYSINNDYPVLSNVSTNSVYEPELGYDTDSHYVVLVGFYYDSTQNIYMAVLNDPHPVLDAVSQTILPLSSLYRFNVELERASDHIGALAT